jgi:hypothetical protein
MDPIRADRDDPAWAALLGRRHDAGQGVGAWRALLPAIAADVAAQPLMTPAELTPSTSAMVVCGDRDPFVQSGSLGARPPAPGWPPVRAAGCGHEG